MDDRGAGGALADAGSAGAWQEGPRVWRPRISDHSILRYLQRVKRMALPDEIEGRIREEIINQGVSVEAVELMIWPECMALPSDPRCPFVMKRDGFVYPVRHGWLRTVLYGSHYVPAPLARSSDLR